MPLLQVTSNIALSESEKLIGRTLPIPVMEKIYGITIVLLLTMVVYITFFDVSRVGRAIGLLDDKAPSPTNEQVEEARP